MPVVGSGGQCFSFVLKLDQSICSEQPYWESLCQVIGEGSLAHSQISRYSNALSGHLQEAVEVVCNR